MNNMRLKPAMHYQLNYMFWASLCILGIAAAIVVFLRLVVGVVVININIGGDTSQGDFLFSVGAILAITFFIIGIAGIREDLKFFIQHGMGRCTTYFSHILTSLASGLALGLLCELLNLFSRAWPAFPVSGLMFSDQGFLAGWMLHTLCFFFVWQLGALISLIYYRMSNWIQVTIFSILLFGLPTFIGLAIGDFDGVVNTIVNFFVNPPAFAPLFVIGGILAALGNFLLIRRAQIKE